MRMTALFPRLAPALVWVPLALAFAPALAAPPAQLMPGQRPMAGTTEAELWYGMDQAEKQIKQSPYLVRDPALQAYVEGVVCKVAGEHCKELRVYIVEVPVFNASMAPNGATLLFTGALLRMRDESELAVVLGHEFAHYKARHSLEGWNSAKRTAAILNTFGLVTMTVGVPLAGELAAIGGVGGLYKQSRDNEREADAMGFAAATGLGYDAQAGVRVWERLRREEQADRTHRDRAIFASHPQSAERIADIRAAAASLAHQASPITHREEYRAAIQPFQQEWLASELSRRSYDTTVQVLGELQTEGDPAVRGLYTFYLGEAYRRRNHEGDAARAAASYAQAIGEPGAPAAAWREQGMLQQANNNPAAARDSLQRYLELAPQAEDAVLVRHYLAQLEGHP